MGKLSFSPDITVIFSTDGHSAWRLNLIPLWGFGGGRALSRGTLAGSEKLERLRIQMSNAFAPRAAICSL
jgi:hypothetical protein